MHNHRITRAIILILTICYSLTVKADLPELHISMTDTLKTEILFQINPIYNYDLTNLGKTIVYDGKSKRALKIDNYLPTKAFISNTGRL